MGHTQTPKSTVQTHHRLVGFPLTQSTHNRLGMDTPPTPRRTASCQSIIFLPSSLSVRMGWRAQEVRLSAHHNILYKLPCAVRFTSLPHCHGFHESDRTCQVLGVVESNAFGCGRGPRRHVLVILKLGPPCTKPFTSASPPGRRSDDLVGGESMERRKRSSKVCQRAKRKLGSWASGMSDDLIHRETGSDWSLNLCRRVGDELQPPKVSQGSAVSESRSGRSAAIGFNNESQDC